MKRRTKKIKLQTGASSLKLYRGGVHSMSYKDLKRRAIVLGMPFEMAAAATFGQLQSWIVNSNAKPNSQLIDDFDDWVDKELEKRGYSKKDPLRSPMLRLGYLGETKEGEVKVRRIRGIPRNKEKVLRERTEEGYWKGTKKAYTVELTKRGFSFDRVWRRVSKKFPEALEKSVKQWYRHTVKDMKNAETKKDKVA